MKTCQNQDQIEDIVLPTIIEAFITSIWCGANRFLHTEVTRHDSVLGNMFDWQNTPGQDVYKRFFAKFNVIIRIWLKLMRRMWAW